MAQLMCHRRRDRQLGNERQITELQSCCTCTSKMFPVLQAVAPQHTRLPGVVTHSQSCLHSKLHTSTCSAIVQCTARRHQRASKWKRSVGAVSRLNLVLRSSTTDNVHRDMATVEEIAFELQETTQELGLRHADRQNALLSVSGRVQASCR